MKFLLLSVITLLAKLTFAQSNLPLFLIGNWKIENKESYEQWDKVNETTLKGFAYKLKNDQMLVTEYLDISETKKGINYYATVLNQNQGKAVNFRLKNKIVPLLLKIQIMNSVCRFSAIVVFYKFLLI